MAAVAHAPLSLMSCVRESSPVTSPHCTRSPHSLHGQVQEDVRHEPKKRSFHPLRGLRRMFRRKSRSSAPEGVVGSQPALGAPQHDVAPAAPEGAPRSSSTGRLLADPPPSKTNRRTSSGLYPGLSVSHDSVFTAEPSDQSGSDTASSHSIQRLVPPGVRAELVDALRRRNQRGRGDTSEDDEDLGLPRSPCNSPTTADILLEPSHCKDQSTCSDGSLLSVGSSDLDEDSFGQSSSRHSSKLSLQDKRSAQDLSGDRELDVGVTTTPLSHSAAKHKMAVKPKRTHGAPRRRRIQQLSAPVLPTTPELNEESSGRSVTPEIPETCSKTAAPHSPECPPDPTPAPLHLHGSNSHHLKSASLPPGIALRPTGVTRSRSSAAYRQDRDRSPTGTKYQRSGSSEQLQPHSQPPEPEPERKQEIKEDKKKEDLSFFGRFLSRRSGKKKKNDKCMEENTAQVASHPPLPPISPYSSVYAASQHEQEVFLPTRRIDEKGRYAAEADSAQSLSTQYLSNKSKASNVARAAASSAAARQRLEPITIPHSPEPRNQEESYGDLDEPARTYEKASPLEGVPSPVKPDPITRMQISYSTSPTRPSWMQPVLSRSPPNHWISASECKVVELIEKSPEAKNLTEESRVKSKIPGLTAYQQRVAQMATASLSEASAEKDFSSLTDSTNDGEAPRQSSGRAPVQKSRSFRREDDKSHLILDTPSLPIGLGYNHESSSSPNTVQNYEEVLKQFDDEINTLSLSHSEETFSGSPDSLDTSTKDESDSISTNTKVHFGDRAPENSEYFDKNVLISAKTASKRESKIPISDSDDTKLQASKVKSSSLDSIESFRESKVLSPSLGKKKASSNENLNHGMHQVTIPMGNGGLSITQQVITTEAHSVTVACNSSSVSSTVTNPAPPSVVEPKVTLVNVSSTSKPTKPEIPDKPDKLERLEKTIKTEPTAPVFDNSQSPPARNSAIRKSLPPEEMNSQLPEFMRVQLNRVDTKPVVNVVLSTSVSPSEPEKSTQDAEEKLHRSKSIDIIDPWSVEELPNSSPKREEPVHVTLLGLRVKHNGSRDDLSLEVSETQNQLHSTKGTEDEAPAPPPKMQKPILAPLSLPSTPVSQKVSNQPITAKSPIRKQVGKFDFIKPDVPAKRVPVFPEDNNNVVIVEKKKTMETQKSAEEETNSLRRKSVSRDSLSWLNEDTGSRESIGPEVVLRKKSLPRDLETSKDDTPELMKVFARRSMKVRDSESEQSLDSDTAPEQMTRSRDSSDKENDGGESPKEERRKSLKETSNELKDTTTKNTTVTNGINGRYQRSLSTGNEITPKLEKSSETILSAYRKDNVDFSPDKRLRTRNMTEPVIVDKPPRWSVSNEKDLKSENDNSVAKLTARWTMPPPESKNENEKAVPAFKGIQQRREEWEQRAQQAAKAGP